MDAFIEFVTANSMWFIIGGIVIVMAIIGYFVDKTDFGRKKEEKEPKEPKEQKPKKEKKEKKQKVEIENKGLNDLTKPVEVEETKEETTTADVKDEDLFTPLSNEINAELGNEVVDESLFEPLTSESTTEQPIDVTKQTSDVTPIEVPAENTETPVETADSSVEQPTEEKKSEDDVWKF